MRAGAMRMQIGNYSFNSLLNDILLFLVVFVTGGLIYLVLRNYFQILISFFAYAKGVFPILYHKAGVVFWGLMPLSAFLLYLTAQILAERFGVFQVKTPFHRRLHFVIEAGPMLGILGTMISISKAMMETDMSKGVQFAINHLSNLVGQSLNSSVWGILLAMIAFVLTFLTNEEKEEG